MKGYWVVQIRQPSFAIFFLKDHRLIFYGVPWLFFGKVVSLDSYNGPYGPYKAKLWSYLNDGPNYAT